MKHRTFAAKQPDLVANWVVFLIYGGESTHDDIVMLESCVYC